MPISFSRIRRRLGGLYADESGAAALFAVVSLMFLVIVVAYVHNVGMTVNRRIRLQNAADAAAYSGAMVEANALSAIAWLNSCQTYVYARMQESILEMMPLATGAGAVQWGRYVFDEFQSAPVGFLGEAPHEEPAELRDIANTFADKFSQGAEDKLASIAGSGDSVSANANMRGEAETLGENIENVQKEYAAAEAKKKAAEDEMILIDSKRRAAEALLLEASDPAERTRIQFEINDLNEKREAQNDIAIAASFEMIQLENKANELNDRAEAMLGGIGVDKDSAKYMEGLACTFKDKKPDIKKGEDMQTYWEKPYDPPPVWDGLTIIPIVGNVVSSLTGSEGHKVVDGQMATLAQDFPNDAFVRDGAPPWEEFKLAMAGYFPSAVALWNARLSVLFNDSIDSTDDLVNFVKEKALPLVKEWVGSRVRTDSGSRPGETWIRQLSTVASSIAKAMPEMVRNEMLYSLSVNAPPGTLAAIYPAHDEQNPEDSWGNVAFARYDRDNGKAFFRYDHFAMPPTPWVRPPYWTNSYPLAAELVSRVLPGDSSKGFLGYEDDLRQSNPALWEENGSVYGNRFLHEARRQNSRMRSVQPNDLLARFGIPVGSVGDVELLAYAEKETQSEADAHGSHGYPPHLRMKLANTFYYDEYFGRPGRDDNGKGDGFALRKTNMGWNRNDRYWNKEPFEDNKDRRTTMFSNISLWGFRPLLIPLPLPAGWGIDWLIPNDENPNYNIHPRDDLGYAPGSSIPFLGHLPFVRSSGNVNDERDAADGHWHAEHYHSSSVNDNHSYPNTFCPGLNCMLMGAFRYMFGGRSQWEGNVHVPYKHWDGWTGNDSEESQKAADYHIHSAINDDHAGQNSLYNLAGARASSKRKRPERLPVSLYNLCIGCDTAGILFVRVCTCGGCRDEGIHGSRGSASWFPKDSMFLYNTPVLWIRDYSPHIASALGAWLTWGDIEGDPNLFFGCGDPYFYDWLYMGIDALTESLPSDNSLVGTVKGWLEGAVSAPLHEMYPLEADDAINALRNVSGIDVSSLIQELGGANIQSEGAMKIATILFDTLFHRTGHHRFLQDPLTMGICPSCGERHLGGDWGPHKNADYLYQLLDTGDRRVDAGMAYSQLLKGHDFGFTSRYRKLDLGLDIDDGLAEEGTSRHWTQNFAADRFVREWFAPVPGENAHGGSNYDPQPDTDFSPAVVLTENFFRHGVSVALVEKYRPVFGMFGAERTITAVATARVGFIERLPDSVFPDSPGDGKGAGDSPQIITGADEIGADGRIWDLDRIWSEFIDFPNQKPEVESNLYYADYGVKLVSTRYAILANAGSGDNARRATDNRYTSMEDAEIAFWKELGAVTCFLPDGTATGTTLADAMLPGEDWDKFASEYVQTRYAMEGDVR